MSGNRSKGLSMRLKLIVAGLLTVCAASAIVAFVFVSNNNKMEPSPALAQKRSMEPQESNEQEVEETGEGQRFARQTFSSEDSRNDMKEYSCFTDVNNQTVPGAHIFGVEFKRNNGQGNPSINGYWQLWRCSDQNDKKDHHSRNRFITAYMEGGMDYDQSEQKLTVPLCGYYQINSQVLFRYQTNRKNTEVVHHILKYTRECEGWPAYGEIAVTGRNTIDPNTSVTTHTSDVIKLCAGAKIWIEIPEHPMNHDLIPGGDSDATFLSVAMVSKTSCHWPPDVRMSNTDHSHDNDDIE